MTKPWVTLTLLLTISAAAQAPNAAAPARMPRGAKVYIAPMNGLGPYLALAFVTRKVPVVTVPKPGQADYTITGKSEIEEPGRLKKMIAPGAKSDASITLQDKNGNILWTDSVNKFDTQIPNQSMAEACAKHLKEWMERKK